MMPDMDGSLELRVLLRREGDWWVAVCVEYFFATQARTIAGAQESFRQAYLAALLHAHQTGRPAFENVAAAPQRYVDEYEHAVHLGSVRLEPVAANSARASFKRAA